MIEELIILPEAELDIVEGASHFCILALNPANCEWRMENGEWKIAPFSIFNFQLTIAQFSILNLPNTRCTLINLATVGSNAD